MIMCIFSYATNNEKFLKGPPDSTSILLARFSACMFMHIAVEKDVRNGLQMMKYAINHPANFVNPIAAFAFGWFLFIISIIVELNVMLVMTTLADVMDIAMKYISLAAIVNIPRFYFASLKNNRMLVCKDLNLKISVTRADNPLKGAPCHMKLLRYIYKFCRTIFCSFGFYFTPFVAIFINIKFMMPGDFDDPVRCAGKMGK